MEILLKQPYLSNGIGSVISVSPKRGKSLIKNKIGQAIKEEKETAVKKKKETADK